MRKLIPLLIVGFLAAPSLFAQQATNNVPVVRASEDNLRVEAVYKTRDSGGRWEVQVSVRDSGGVEIRRQSYTGPDAAHPSATVLALQTAERTARGGETGGVARTSDFRILGFLFDNGYLLGTTLAP